MRTRQTLVRVLNKSFQFHLQSPGHSSLNMHLAQAISRITLRELDVFFSFSWRDWSTTIIPVFLFSLGGIRHSELDTVSIFASYVFLALWITCFIYFFNLSNQITGIDEDRINKPDRPIPSGKVTLKGAWSRWILCLVAFLELTLVKPSFLLETLCWIATTAFLSLTTAGNHWFGKNCIAMSTGGWSMLNVSWKLTAPVTPQSQSRIVALSLWGGLAAHVQDLRDMQGDMVVGRKTLPLVFGDRQSRHIMTFILLPLAVLVLWIGGIVQIAPIIVLGLHVFLGWRIMQQKGPQYDHKTYMIFTYIFCICVALSSLRDLNWI